MARFLECHARIRKPGRRFEWIPRWPRWFKCVMEVFGTIAYYLYCYKWGRRGSTNHAVVSSSSKTPLDNEDIPRKTVILPQKMNTVRIPSEILDANLRFLPYSSLYILRQTSRSSRQYIDNDPVFRGFHTVSRWHRTAPAAVRDSREIYTSLRRQTLCTEYRAVSTDERRERLISLCEPRSCTSCKKDHAGIFFPVNGRKRNKCVGLLGHYDVCSHRRLDFQWRIPKPWTQYPIYDRCMDGSHASSKGINKDPDPISEQYIPTIEVNSCKFPGTIATTTSLTFEISGIWETKSMGRYFPRGVLQDCGQLCPHSLTAMERLLNNLECTLYCCRYFGNSIPVRDDGCVSRRYTCKECNVISQGS